MGHAPASARVTASAFVSPAARTQTSRAAWMAGNVRVIRTGGGLGESRTATVVARASTTGEPGKIDATWPSGPMPSSSTSKAGAAAVVSAVLLAGAGEPAVARPARSRA